MERTRPQNKTGSALLVTLLVMGLMTLLVLAFSTHVRLELRNISNHQNQHLARANARLGLELALAQLQAAAGPDQRVTARAEILGNGVARENSTLWTGVWSSSSAGGISSQPEWLVSGKTPEPTALLGDDSIQLFPPTSRQPAVKAPAVKIENNNITSGKYAYWIADEGVKSSSVARRGAIELFEKTILAPKRQITEFQSDFGVDLSPFFTLPNIDLTDTLTSSQFERITHINSLPFVSDSSEELLDPILGIREHTHDLTLLAKGVLENPVDGGLKKNLSDPTFLDNFLATPELHLFLAPKGDYLDVDFSSPSERGITEGMPFFAPRPLLTEAALYMGIFHTWNDAKLRIRYHFEAEFVNPYSLPLRFPLDTGSGNYNRALILYFDNLPTITVRDLTVPTDTPVITENMNLLSAYSPNDSRSFIHSWFEISQDKTNPSPVLLAGEVYRVMEPNPSTQTRGIARDFGTVRWAEIHDTRPDNSAQIEIEAIHPQGGVSLNVVPFYSPGHPLADTLPRDRTPLLSFHGLSFDDFKINKTFNDGQNPFSRLQSTTYLKDDYIIAYHFRIASDASDQNSMQDILTAVDLRDPKKSKSEEFTDIDGNQKSYAILFSPEQTDPSFIVLDDSNIFSGLDQFTDGTARSHIPDFVPAVLYDIPNGDTLSVGQLSSLHIYKRAPRSIGNPWGKELNKAFDRYYLSPRINNPLTTADISANPAYANIDDPPPQTPLSEFAPYEMIIGHFNVNSTSASAWEAVLAAPVLTPSAIDEAESLGISRRATFIRLPWYQALLNDDFFVTKDELKKSKNAFAQGLRSLHDSEGRRQLRALAENIVQELKLRSEPFANLTDFLNSGLLQKAIDDVGPPTGNMTDTEAPPLPPPINQGLFKFSNVYLTQSDLMTKIAPFASNRSDTFKVRAFGNALGPGGNQLSSAYLEAVVQRIPQKLDGSDPLQPSISLSDSRKFIIRSFRWLTDEEI